MNPYLPPVDPPSTELQSGGGFVRFCLAIAFSSSLGVAWHFIAFAIMNSGSLTDVSEWSAAGAFAGACSGVHTIWSRRRNGGRESVLAGFATYYLGITTYWIGILALEHVPGLFEAGAFSTFDLQDHLKMIVWFLVIGTVPLAIPLMPLNFGSRFAVWLVYAGRTEKHGKPCNADGADLTHRVVS